MSKFKVILGYLFGFISSVLLTFASVLFIFKLTIFNKSYILKSLENENYYSKVYDEIGSDMKNSLLSSGLDESILENLYSENDVKRDVKDIVGAIYSGSKLNVSIDKMEDRLNTNIEKFLDNKNIEVPKSSLASYVSGIMDIYKDEIGLYGYLDNYVNKFVKLGNYLDLGIACLLIVYILIVLICKYGIKFKGFGISLFASSMMLIYLKYFIYGKIDFKNILIISKAFSGVLRKILMDIDEYGSIFVFVYMMVGILVIFKNSFKKNKRRKKIS